MVYLDQYSGKVLGDVGFKDWGPAAKAIEWGIAVHQGQEYGPLNRYLMLAGCICVVLLAVTSITMWWKRRPKGSLGRAAGAGGAARRARVGRHLGRRGDHLPPGRRVTGRRAFG